VINEAFLEVDVLDLTRLSSRFENRARHRQVLDGDSGAVENRDLGIGSSAGAFSKRDQSQSTDVIG
jgi:hypothetical protein